MKNIIKIYNILNSKERTSLRKLVILVIFMATMDMLGVVSIMPFMALIANPDIISESDLISGIYIFFDFDDYESFIIFSGIFVIIFYILSLSFKAYVSYLTLKFASKKEYSISERLFESYLRRPYSWYLERNTADLSKTILSEVSEVITFGIMPLLNLIAYGTVCIALLILVIAFNPVMALISAGSLGGSYLLIYLYISKKVDHLGYQRAAENRKRFNALSETFGGIKDVKLRDLEDICSVNFSTSAKIYAERHATAQILGMLPRFALEAVAFGGLLLLTISLTFALGSIEEVLPILSLYAFAAYRLMPALNQVYYSSTQLKFVTGALQNISVDEMEYEKPQLIKTSHSPELNGNLALENITFGYQANSKNILNGLSLSISAGEKVAFIGTTGSGKSTAVDLIVGLLEPDAGQITVDGTFIDVTTVGRWKQNIGYVPQTIYLTDNTILSNIALGIPFDEIDYERVKEVAKVARIHEFINNELELGYDTRVGERGVRFSGGQRQRLGIARALYHNPSVLIMDEGTSALDIATETQVMNEIQHFSKDMTVIMVAHRLQTVKNCDKIYYFENGTAELLRSIDDLKMKEGFDTV
jgi:ABC-type bacteriocin/lantibiotic exporter with double-glycine peptidase domain